METSPTIHHPAQHRRELQRPRAALAQRGAQACHLIGQKPVQDFAVDWCICGIVMGSYDIYIYLPGIWHCVMSIWGVFDGKMFCDYCLHDAFRKNNIPIIILTRSGKPSRLWSLKKKTASLISSWCSDFWLVPGPPTITYGDILVRSLPYFLREISWDNHQ